MNGWFVRNWKAQQRKKTIEKITMLVGTKLRSYEGRLFVFSATFRTLWNVEIEIDFLPVFSTF